MPSEDAYLDSYWEDKYEIQQQSQLDRSEWDAARYDDYDDYDGSDDLDDWDDDQIEALFQKQDDGYSYPW